MDEMISTIVENEDLDIDSIRQEQKNLQNREKAIFSPNPEYLSPISAPPTKMLNNFLQVSEIRHSKSDHFMPESLKWSYKTEMKSLFCPELSLKINNDSFSTPNKESLITENISVTCKEVKGKNLFDFVSNHSQVNESTIIKTSESFNTKMEDTTLTKDNSETFKDMKILTESENKSNLIENMVHFEKGDNKTPIFEKCNEKLLPLPIHTIECKKYVEKLTKVEKSLSVSSLYKELTQEYKNIYESKESFHTNSHHVDSIFQAVSSFEDSVGISSYYSSENSEKQIIKQKNCLKKFNFKIIRSNQVSPVGMKSEVISKSKVRRFASTFIKGVRKSFQNIRQACRSRRNRSSLVLCSVPMYLYL